VGAPELEAWCRANLVPKLPVPTQINTPLDDELAVITTGRTLHLTNFEMPATPCAVVEEGDLIRAAYVKKPGLTWQDAVGRSAKWLELLELPRTMPQARSSRASGI